MPFNLPKLGPFAVVQSDGRPTTSFQSWINKAFKKIEDSVTDLATTLGLIATAQATADTALQGVQDAAADGIVDPQEKKALVIPRYAVITGQQTDLDAKATAYGITTEKTTYDNAISALTTYLGTLTTPYAWNNTAGNTTVVRATWDAKWKDVDVAQQALTNKIGQVAGTVSTWTGVTGSGKPADNATVNVVTHSSSAPSSPTNGDIWVDTSVTPNLVKMRVAGAWQNAANYTTNTTHLTDGANLGGTAVWTGVTGSGKPADNATVNNVTYSASAPSSPTNGDVWVDTSVTPNQIKVRVSGAWQVGANNATNTTHLTDGANLGGTAVWSGVTGSGKPADNATVGATWGTNLSGRPSNLAALSGSEGIQNTLISLSSAGALAGAGGGSIAYDDLPNGTTYAKIRASQLTSGNHKLTIAGSNTRLGDQRNMPMIAAMNLRYKFVKTSDGSNPLSYTATAGTPATATITMAASTAYIGNQTVTYNSDTENVTGTGGTSVTYHIYLTDASYAGGSKAITATTNSLAIYQDDDRVWVGSLTVAFPAAGGGGGGGDYGGGGWCVAHDAWVETRNRGYVQAAEIVEGDHLRCLTEDRESTEWMPVLSNAVKVEPAVRITSESGVTVRVSENTPVTLRDGSSINVTEIDGHELPVYVDDLVWEPCKVESIPQLPVAYISLGGKVYAAGDEQGRSILTHNPDKP